MPQQPRPASWPQADFIIGNPPFLGTKLLRGGLGDEYVKHLFTTYKDRIPGFSDLCCYWFELAREAIARSPSVRVGLLATQGIRGGENRTVLERIKQTGSIFMAWSDREWVLDGANVHVSIVGFDGGTEQQRVLDGRVVASINSDLSSGEDLTTAQKLKENEQIGFVADVKAGAFDVQSSTAREWLQVPNPNGRPNAEVLFPWLNGQDITGRLRNMWIVDFGSDMAVREAAAYELPFEHVVTHVKPKRDPVKRKRYREYWWLHAEPCARMRQAIAPLPRFLVTPTLTKHRLFAFLQGEVLPDHQLIAFARSDNYFFGVLHSSVHELWARRMGTQLREAESGFRYTPTTCFETFPLPWPPGTEPANVAQPPPAETKPVAQPPSAETNAQRRAAVPRFAKPSPGRYRRNLPHIQAEGRAMFVTFCTYRGWILPEPVRETVIRHCLHDHGTKLHMHGLVVMPDHVHLVFTPLTDAEGQPYGLPEIMNGIKGASAHSINKALGRKGHVWQAESFDHILRRNESIEEKLEYIFQNPVRKGLLSCGEDYPWTWMDPGEEHVAQPPSAETEPVAQPPPAETEPVAQPPPAERDTQPRAAGPHEVYERIADAARRLNTQRERWLNPPEWIDPIAVTIDAEDDFTDVPAEARLLIRHSAIMAAAAKDPNLKRRTLTNLYNERPTWLRLAHDALDRAVLAAYAAVDPEGEWSEDWAAVWVETGAGQPLPDGHELADQREEIEQRVLANLLRLNLARAGE